MRGHVLIEDSVDASIQRLEKYIKKRRGRLITATRNKTNSKSSNRTKITTRKTTVWAFKRLTNNIQHEKTRTWLRKRDLKRKTDCLQIATQNNAFRAMSKQSIDLTEQNNRSRLCDDKDETINLIIKECRKLAQKEYNTRHDWIGKVVHWELCKKFKFDYTLPFQLTIG